MKACTLLICISAGATIAHVATADTVWRAEGHCGVNVAYAFLRVNDVDVRYDRLLQTVPCDPRNGTTIEEVADAIRTYGVNVDVGKGSPSELAQLRLPVIAHLERDNPERGDHSQMGHYVLLVSVAGDSVRYMDGATGIFYDVPLEQFVNDWSGYLIFRRSNGYARWFFTGIAAGSLAASLTLVVRRFSRFVTIGRKRGAQR